MARCGRRRILSLGGSFRVPTASVYIRGSLGDPMDSVVFWENSSAVHTADSCNLGRTPRGGRRVDSSSRWGYWTVLAVAIPLSSTLRNGTEAVTLAAHAVHLSSGSEPAILATLAAAFAETGRCDKAVELEQRDRRRHPARKCPHGGHSACPAGDAAGKDRDSPALTSTKWVCRRSIN